MLAITGSVVGAAAIARIYVGKLDMEIMLNATLAGGVAIGSSADLVVNPGIALLIGLAGGVLSAVGFKTIGPWLADHIGLHDTCGVNSLHGMPGIFAAVLSIPIVASMDGLGFPDDYFDVTYGE